jgi:hypothetical protein
MSKELTPVDPSVLAGTEPWVRLLFERFDQVETNNKGRHDDFKTELQTLKTQQENTTKDVSALKDDQAALQAEMTSVNGKVDSLAEEFAAYRRSQDQKLRELLSKYDSDVSSIRVPVPTLSVREQSSVEKQFDDLLAEANSMQTAFVVRVIDGQTPSVSIQVLLQRHFADCGVKLLPQAGKSGVRRFIVKPDKVGRAKNEIKHYNMAIRDLGWWVVQDAPPALRAMNLVVYKFFKAAKEWFPLLRKFRFETEGGFATMNEVPIVPVYLVPRKETLWKKLASLLMEVVADFLDLEWLETACSRMVIPENFTSRWCSILKEAGVYRPGPKNDIPSRQLEDRSVERYGAEKDGNDMDTNVQGGG